MFLPSTVVGILGVVSNALLLVTFLKDPLKCFRNSGTYLVINLSVSDFLISLVCLLSNVARRISSSPAPIFVFFIYFIGSVSFVSVTSISIDRFLTVAFPMKHRILMKGKVMIAWITAIWTANFAISALALFLDTLESSGKRALASYNVIFITLSSVMYLSTYHKLKTQSGNIALQNSIESRAQAIRILKEKRFLNTILMIGCIAFLCTVPFLLLFELYNSGGSGFKILYAICSFIFYANFAVNPLIYILRLPNYRRTFYLLYWRRKTTSS